jgi:hypothetical protein
MKQGAIIEEIGGEPASGSEETGFQTWHDTYSLLQLGGDRKLSRRLGRGGETGVRSSSRAELRSRKEYGPP